MAEEYYEKKYKEALSRAATELETCGADKSLRNMIYAIFPDELKESEDEKIRNRILLSLEKDLMATKNSGCDTQDLEQCIAWLEKQGESYTKKDIDDAYLKGISDAKDELEKQGTSAKLSEEEQNSFAKGVLSNCAVSFINYLDAHSYEDKMCVSNGECEDIDYAFHNAMWDRLHRYYCKYIEKQDEQKPILDFKASNWCVSKVDGKIHDMTYNPANKINPKFKVDNWIIFNGFILHIDEVVNGYYRTTTFDGISNSYSWDIDNVARLWTIQDAKDGDVLAGNKGDVILMFRRIGNTEYNDVIDYHCYYDCYWKEFIVQKDLQYWGDTNNNQLKPATKEQRDLLFCKMKEAGYEFDFEKKELKKIDDEIEIPFGAKDSELQEETYYIPKGFHAEIKDDKVVIKKGEKSAEWSNEDEKMCKIAFSCIETLEDISNGKNMHADVKDWLKSLKDRIGG